MNRLAIVRVPLRVSFVGGGSDLPGGDGAVIGATIDKWVYCVAKSRDDGQAYLTWREKEIVGHVRELRHDLVREALVRLDVEANVEVLLFSDVPGVGSGLGSSSATTIAVLLAASLLKGYSQEDCDADWLAGTAFDIEARVLGRKCGPQDQCVCAHGGIVILHTRDGELEDVHSIDLSRVRWREVNDRFMLFRPRKPNMGRDATAVLSGFVDSEAFRESCARLVDRFASALDYDPMDEIPELIAQHHALKRASFPGYWTDEAIAASDAFPPEAKYKLCGAGGVGHLLVCAEPGKRSAVRTGFEAAWGKELPFRFGEFEPEVLRIE